MSIHSWVLMDIGVDNVDKTIVRMTIASIDWKQAKRLACQNESLEVAIEGLYQMTQKLNIDPSSPVKVWSTNKYVTDLWKKFYPNMITLSQAPEYFTKRVPYETRE